MSLKNRILQAMRTRLSVDFQRPPGFHRVRLMVACGVDLVVDVGAASGGYGAELRRLGYGNRIVSFEPLHGAFSTLQSRAAADAQWEVHRAALGSEPGQAAINVAANGDSSSFLPMLDKHRASAPYTAYVSQEHVPVWRLDDVWETVSIGADRPFLKMDTQGFEGQVLDGAQEAIGKVAGVQIELSMVPLYGDAISYDQAILRMRDAGFVPAGIEPGFRDPVTGQLLQADFLFMRAELLAQHTPCLDRI